MIATDRVDLRHSAPPRPHARPLLADLVPDESSVLWLGAIADDATRDLESRGCRIAIVRSEEHEDPTDGRAIFERFDFGRARHDVAVLPDLLGRVAAPEELLIAIRRALKAGGRIVASVPDSAHPAILRALTDGSSPYTPDGPIDPGQLRLYTRESLIASVESADFAVAKLRAILDPREEGVPAGWIAIGYALPVQGLELMQERFRKLAMDLADADVTSHSLRGIVDSTRLALQAAHLRAEERASDARSARSELLQERERASVLDAEITQTIRDLLGRLEELEPLRHERDAAHRHAIAAEARCCALEGRIEHILMEVPRRVARAIRRPFRRRTS